MRRSTAHREFLVGVVLLLVGSAGVLAEVGVFHDSARPQYPSRPYLQSIVDDGDPINGIWAQLSPPSLPRAVLNETGDVNGDGPPSILYVPASDLSVVAWARNSPPGFDVVVSRFDGGTWTAPEVIAGSPAADELDPSLFLAPDGTVHLVYWVDDGIGLTVMHRFAPADLSTWSAAQPVSEPTEDACRPSGVYHDGVLRVVYEVMPVGGGTSPKQIVVAREQGGSFTHEYVATSLHAGELWPQAHSHAGRIWIDWIDTTYSGPEDGEMAWKRVGASGGWEPTLFEPFTSEEARDFHVRGLIRSKAILP